MPRKDHSPAISFFSFQDIITSVTGIMFLVMLILTLLLLTRQKMDSPSRPRETEEIRTLRENLRQLQDDIARVTAQSQKTQKRIEELKKLDAKSIPRRRQEILEKIADLKNTLETLRQKQTQTRQTIDDLSRQTAQLTADNSDKEQKLTALKDDRQQKSAQKDKLEEEKKNASKVMRFTWARSLAQKPILVECAGNVIRAGHYNSDVPLVEFTGGSTPGEQAGLRERFFVWAQSFKPADTYFILLAKPSGFENAEYMSLFLGVKGFLRGREVLPGDDVVVFQSAQEKP